MDSLVETLVTDRSQRSLLPAECQELVIDLDHIAIAVEDLGEAVSWYVEKLGFKARDRRLTQGAHSAMLSAVLTAGKAVVVLVQGTSRESPITKFIEEFGPGVQHVAFAVSNLDEAIQRLETARGAADTPVIEDEGIRQVFLRRDPGSGVRVELIERRGGDFSDETVGELFRAFEARELW